MLSNLTKARECHEELTEILDRADTGAAFVGLAEKEVSEVCVRPYTVS
jgi:hypothetical protein